MNASANLTDGKFSSENEPHGAEQALKGVPDFLFQVVFDIRSLCFGRRFSNRPFPGSTRGSCPCSVRGNDENVQLSALVRLWRTSDAKAAARQNLRCPGASAGENIRSFSVESAFLKALPFARPVLGRSEQDAANPFGKRRR